MNKNELNLRTRRLLKKFKESQGTTNHLISDKEEKEIQSELKAIWGADKEFTYLTKHSMVILLRLNVRVNAVPHHSFGLYIPLKKL